MPTSSVEEREAVYGTKMIEVKLRFWTDDIAADGKILPKHAWTSGVVRMGANTSHGIKARKPKPFNSLLDIGAVVEAVLLAHGIQLHPSSRMRKYVSPRA